MGASNTLIYCTDRQMTDVYPGIDDASQQGRRRIINWVEVESSTKYKSDSSGLVTQLFADGVELGGESSDIADVNSNGEWYYDSNKDAIYYYNSNTSPNDLVMEAGDDYSDLKSRMRAKASRLIESKINSVAQGEITKDEYGEFPTVIVHITALQAIILILSMTDPGNDFIEPFKEELEEYIQGILGGSIIIGNVATADVQKGVIRDASVSSNSTLRAVELRGSYNLSGFDRIKIKVIAGGVLGTATYSAWMKNSDSLKSNQIVTEEKIDGDYQTIGSGLYIRFGSPRGTSGSATANDEYEVECWGYNTNSRVSGIGSIRKTRF